MPTYTHGGDLRAAQIQYGGPVLDFSASLNPLGMPGAVRRAAAEAVEACVHYPDPFCRDLCGAIARHDGVQAGQVLCGGGAADLIFRLAFALRPRQALVAAPTFSLYEEALAAVGCAVERYPLLWAENFDLDLGILEEITPGLDIVFLCNPNNPTGRLIPPELLGQIAQRCGATGTRLVVDECFLPLSNGAGGGMASQLEACPHMLLLRALTKSYALPGLRLGYALSADGALLEAMTQQGPPWSVSTPAQAAGIAALEQCPGWPEQARALIAQARPVLAEGLAGLGFQVCPGQANYLLFHAPGIPDLRERLLQRGIFIRACGNFPDLGAEDYRVCVSTPEENRRLLAALEEVVSWPKQS